MESIGYILVEFAANGTKNVTPTMYFAKKTPFFLASPHFWRLIIKNMVFSQYSPLLHLIGYILVEFAPNGTKNVIPMMYFAKKITIFSAMTHFKNLK